MVEEEKEEFGDAIKEFNRGLNLHIKGNLDRSLQHFKAALPTFQEFGVKDMIAGTFHEMGMIFQEQGKLNEALDYYQKSLQLSESIKYNKGCEKTLFQIGTLYEEKNDIINANEYYHRSKVYKTKKTGGLNFIIGTYIIFGLWGSGIGLAGITGILEDFEPLFLSPEQWEQILLFISKFGGLMFVLGLFGFISGIGLLRLKGWGWIAGIITSILTIIMITGIITYWYLSKENIQELYGIK